MCVQIENNHHFHKMNINHSPCSDWLVVDNTSYILLNVYAVILFEC